MKVSLDKLPGIADLEVGYQQILSAQRTTDGRIDLNSFATFCQWSRFDSRMGEICVNFLFQFWKKMNPIELHEAFLQQPWPGILGVLLEFCQDNSRLFQLWKRTATCDLKKANWEQFFIGKRRMGGQLMLDDVRFSLEEYRRWGYFGREILLNKQGMQQYRTKKRELLPYSYGVRIQILKDLLSQYSRITTQQYWEAIGKNLSKRQAERDLCSCSFLRSVGKTKGKYFVVR